MLKALDAAAVSLRGQLGESLSSVQKYATPLEEATTPSLEALKAYSLGRRRAHASKGDTAALPFFKRAVELDPNFAIGLRDHRRSSYNNLNEVGAGRGKCTQGLRAAGEGERTGSGSASRQTITCTRRESWRRRRRSTNCGSRSTRETTCLT